VRGSVIIFLSRSWGPL